LQQVGGSVEVSPQVHLAPAPDPAAAFTVSAGNSSLASGRMSLPPPRRRWRVRRRPYGRKLGLGLFVVLSVVLALSLLTDRGRQADALLSLPAGDELLSRTGLRIDQVAVSGHRHTADADIFDAIDLPHAHSLLGFDSAAARARIERLPWIASARISRVFPGSLDVRIKERQPAASWMRDGREYLIDAQGRVLSAVEPGTKASLPRVAGEGAADQARSLLDLVKHYPAIAKRFELAERVGKRRWTLRLKDGVTIHLGAGREAAAFAMLSSATDLGMLLSASDLIIDLRTSGRVVVRPDRRRNGAHTQFSTQSQARS